ncbi:hypothetical protein [Mucilaginibacter jinjuensis]|uniref:Uncharacterized protein n=1 Tax=Mucilaginibacter jinjuensis TaxID=1176721 RepID=A0ABY7TAJ0_9SPHI|nr:hypothetical protein [Mucilaginibacter jinjuensis]WCT13249.1 hypothetical protein PQO05_04805 [Mucilaginibacter jinjuensis]
MMTAILLFVPIAIGYYDILTADPRTGMTDWFIGIPLGIGLNYLSIVKLID